MGIYRLRPSRSRVKSTKQLGIFLYSFIIEALFYYKQMEHIALIRNMLHLYFYEMILNPPTIGSGFISSLATFTIPKILSTKKKTPTK